MPDDLTTPAPAASPPASYAEVADRALADPEGFWLEAARAIEWSTPPTIACDRTRLPFSDWFPDGVLNTCHNAVDRHVAAGHGDRAAIVYESPVTGTSATITYAELLAQVTTIAGALVRAGVGKGDRVLIYMPMIPEAVFAMLACARIGAVHVVVFGGFAAQELAARIDDTESAVVLSASCGLEPTRVIDYHALLTRAVDLCQSPPRLCVVRQREEGPAELVEGRDVSWDEFVATGREAPAACVDVAATDPLYILHTSGTTSRPKGIVRDNGGHAVALAWALPAVFDVRPGEVTWAASDVGWVVGHSFIVYAPLLCGATTVLYEGKPVGTPDAGAFWEIVEKHRVVSLLTAPTAIRAIRREDDAGAHASRHDLSSLRALYLAGERLDPSTFAWASSVLGVPVVDNWWQTETGWPVAANPRGLEPLPIVPGSPSVPMPGYDVRILDESGAEVEAGEDGAICIRLPLPPGAMRTVWRDDERFVSTYMDPYPGYYLTGDGGHVDAAGYLFVMGRVDDVINVAGHRLSTGVIEAALAAHPAVAECAVVGVDDDLKGHVPRGFVVLKQDAEIDPEVLARELVGLVRERVGAIAAPSQVDVVPGLPKTRSGKILRRSMREVVAGREGAVPSTIEDVTVLDRFRDNYGPSGGPHRG